MSVSRIPQGVRYLLWAKSAGRCEFNGCNSPLWHDGLTQIEMNFADVAHIIGDRVGGPRGHNARSREYRNNVSNLMLMCLEHHRMIDRIVQTYPEEALRLMKQEHEERMERLTAIKPDRTSQVVIYEGRIGDFHPRIDFRDALLAMSPERYPASHLPIRLGMKNSPFADHENAFWKLEAENLVGQFKDNVSRFLIADDQRNHLSIFAFAPQPLLIMLGSLLSDIYPADVYQLHREPATWEWQPGPEVFEYQVTASETRHPLVALNLSLSADISSDRIGGVFRGEPFSEWRISVRYPNNDFLRGRAQLGLFRKEFRAVLNSIKAQHGDGAVIHLFPAVPVSVAVEIGRVRQPKADLPYFIYDQSNEQHGFVHALTIGGNEK